MQSIPLFSLIGALPLRKLLATGSTWVQMGIQDPSKAILQAIMTYRYVIIVSNIVCSDTFALSCTTSRLWPECSWCTCCRDAVQGSHWLRATVVVQVAIGTITRSRHVDTYVQDKRTRSSLHNHNHSFHSFPSLFSSPLYWSMWWQRVISHPVFLILSPLHHPSPRTQHQHQHQTPGPNHQYPDTTREPSHKTYASISPTPQLNELNNSVYHTSIKHQDSSQKPTLTQPNCFTQLYSHLRAPLTGHLTLTHAQGHLYHLPHHPSVSPIQLQACIPPTCHQCPNLCNYHHQHHQSLIKCPIEMHH